MLVKKVRGRLSNLQRATATALVTADVHNRSVIERLVQEEVSKTSDFAW